MIRVNIAKGPLEDDGTRTLKTRYTLDHTEDFKIAGFDDRAAQYRKAGEVRLHLELLRFVARTAHVRISTGEGKWEANGDIWVSSTVTQGTAYSILADVRNSANEFVARYPQSGFTITYDQDSGEQGHRR